MLSSCTYQPGGWGLQEMGIIPGVVTYVRAVSSDHYGPSFPPTYVYPGSYVKAMIKD